VSEEQLSAESGSSTAGATQSLGEVPESPVIPRQTVDEVPAAPVVQTLDTPAAAEPAPEPPASEPAADEAADKPAAAEPAPVQTLVTEAAPALAPTPEPTPEPAAVPAGATDAAPPRKRRGLLVGVVFGAVVLLLLAAIAIVALVKFPTDPTAKAVAGSCLAGLPTVDQGQDKEATGTKIVDCADPTATHRVEGRIDNQTEDQARQPDICKAFPDATFSFRAIPTGGTGYVLCLKTLDK
jgi:hypothetical protein